MCIRDRYKRSSAEQQEAISDILSRSKKPKVATTKHDHDETSLVRATTSLDTQDTVQYGVEQTQSCSVTQSQKQLLFRPENLQRMFTFNTCSAININVQIQ